MGMLLSKLKGKKVSTKEKLIQIDEDIDKIQNLLQRNRQQQRNAAFFLVAISLSLFVICAGVFYIFYMPTKWTERILYIVPFLLFPVLFIALKKVLHFIFVTRITKNTQQLESLKKEKQKILENVMETETYKVAKEILEKFDPNRALVEKDKKKELVSPQGQELRKRNVGTPSVVQQHGGPRHTMTPRPQNPNQIMSTPRMIMNGQHGAPPPPRLAGNNQMYGGTPQYRAPIQRTPAPIIPRDRSFVDKVAEYFVGDGPSNRYALVCQHCAGHNGMALAEEFMFIAYRCCYCQTFNPARKQRMNAPRLEKPISPQESSIEEDKDEDKENVSEEEIKDNKSGGEEPGDESDKGIAQKAVTDGDEAANSTTPNSEKENED